MRTLVANRIHSCFQRRIARKISSSFSFTISSHDHDPASNPNLVIIDDLKPSCISLKPAFASIIANRHLHVSSSIDSESGRDLDDANQAIDDSKGEVEPIDSWEEEDEAEPEVGDGGDGGGVVLNYCPWGERALSIARETLQEFDEEMQLCAFKTSFKGYGCPSMEEIESFSRKYKKKLDEVSATDQEIPYDLALEVSSSGADRLVRVPDDLLRFKDMAMVVDYLEDSDGRPLEKKGVYHLDSIEAESKCCVWKLADVRENRNPSAKGRPMSRKQRDYRLKLSYDMIKRVKIYITRKRTKLTT